MLTHIIGTSPQSDTKKTDKIPRILEPILVHGLKVRFDRCAMSDFTLTRALDNVSSSTTGAVFVRL